MNDTHEPFSHEQFQGEVEERWGKAAYSASDSWWRAMSPAERRAWMGEATTLGAAWTLAAHSGEDPAGQLAQELAAKHVAWLCSIPGTPAYDLAGDITGYVLGLADMYVADDRFAANYGGIDGATFVRDALRAYLASSPILGRTTTALPEQQGEPS